MVVSNTGPSNNHEVVIRDALKKADEVLLAVSYVKNSGVVRLLQDLQGKQVKLVCSIQMDITDIGALAKLMQSGVQVKIYEPAQRGVLHAKLWLFGASSGWRALIGSANLTESALLHNVEVGVMLDDARLIPDLRIFFHELWDNSDSKVLTPSDVQNLISQQETRRRFAEETGQRTAADEINTMLHFIKSWIGIDITAKRGRLRVWRGWYIIPDHDYVSDSLMLNLAKYVRMIGDSVITGNQSKDSDYLALLDEFYKDTAPERQKLTKHELFVRQAKNYMQTFGWVEHPLKETGKPDKTKLIPTALGRQVAQTQNVADIKLLYTQTLEKFEHFGLKIVGFTRELLKEFRYLTKEEFSYFIIHAYSDNDLATIAELIRMYRRCKDTERIKSEIKAHIENKPKGEVAVWANYEKSVRYTMSAIGWCSGMTFSRDTFRIELAP